MTCTAESCERPTHARDLCDKHYTRWRLHGDPNRTPVIEGRPLVGEHPTFSAVHKRLARKLGPARNRSCVDCAGRAAEWSYDGQDPNQIQGVASGRVVAYSLDLARYQPRCISCHRKFDGAGQRGRNSAGQFLPVTSINTEGGTR